MSACILSKLFPALLILMSMFSALLLHATVPPQKRASPDVADQAKADSNHAQGILEKDGTPLPDSNGQGAMKSASISAPKTSCKVSDSEICNSSVKAEDHALAFRNLDHFQQGVCQPHKVLLRRGHLKRTRHQQAASVCEGPPRVGELLNL
jgi:hypothetical protein